MKSATMTRKISLKSRLPSAFCIAAISLAVLLHGCGAPKTPAGGGQGNSGGGSSDAIDNTNDFTIEVNGQPWDGNSDVHSSKIHVWGQ